MTLAAILAICSILLGGVFMVTETNRFSPMELNFDIPAKGCLGFFMVVGGVITLIVVGVIFFMTYTIQVVPST